MKVNGESEKSVLKLNIQKNKIVASGPIISRQIDGETMETIFLGSKITADGDYIHEIKRRLLLGRRVVTNLDSILKSRDITLQTKIHLVKATVFPLPPSSLLPREIHIIDSSLSLLLPIIFIIKFSHLATLQHLTQPPLPQFNDCFLSLSLM